ncbi:hypothetical protein ACVIHI_008930 [Bradyrhizobium sp. USDA 4524]|uniref:hypothetical protein n=1 Tax=unclassified Bradyrhizobium TaxID=2631580 RepID=UPI00209E8EA5|nr:MULTISPECIES: hypothetical protein [unclassified Bradyrhizobium]MCP1845602.1 hypothetical protein [Bradyrhizobium sp. USDA 4538]MCP1907075.1 hypothetical protein [Bradyrhizobium sp. USDA 4537]MCP1985550.1 hypothetical protein [Bradyrhizobium sp. USDA 4539]
MVSGTKRTNDIALNNTVDDIDLNFLPADLTAQCRNLIESYHDIHGYACLPDMLWRARLGPFIERHHEFRQRLRKASTTRSAKKSNQGFVGIATAILSLEILASSFAGWSALYPEAGARALAVLKRQSGASLTPLMDFYLYPPKYISSAAITKLAPPRAGRTSGSDPYRTSEPDVSGEQLALSHADIMLQNSVGAALLLQRR